MWFMLTLGKKMGPEILLKERASFQLIKTLFNEQRRRLAETQDLVTWIQELGGLAEVVKERGGVFEEAVNEGLGVITPLGRRAFSETNFREYVEPILAAWDQDRRLAEIQLLDEGALPLGLRLRVRDGFPSFFCRLRLYPSPCSSEWILD